MKWNKIILSILNGCYFAAMAKSDNATVGCKCVTICIWSSTPLIRYGWHFLFVRMPEMYLYPMKKVVLLHISKKFLELAIAAK